MTELSEREGRIRRARTLLALLCAMFVAVLTITARAQGTGILPPRTLSKTNRDLPGGEASREAPVP